MPTMKAREAVEPSARPAQAPRPSRRGRGPPKRFAVVLRASRTAPGTGTTTGHLVG